MLTVLPSKDKICPSVLYLPTQMFLPPRCRRGRLKLKIIHYPLSLQLYTIFPISPIFLQLYLILTIADSVATTLCQYHTSPHEVNQSGTPLSPGWRSTLPAPDPFHFDHDLHNSLKVHQGSLLVVVEAATTSSLQMPAERHAILT